MPTLRELTEAIQQRPGVKAVVMLGADGLLIDSYGTPRGSAEALAARVPAVMTAASQLGVAADAGSAELILAEFERGYGVILRLTDHVMLFVSAAADIALGELLFDLRRHRAAMAELV
jgi:predicted regulator of Ras-like GTPase activity (Roadblock/LC7/MglB family)